MGHTRLGRLRQTQVWKDVIALIAKGADVAKVADATNRAAEKAFGTVQNDPGFKDVIHLMTQLGIAASQKVPASHLASAGIILPPDASAVDVAVAIRQELDNRSKTYRQRSDFAAMAQGALISAVTSMIREGPRDLFQPGSDDVSGALSELRKEKVFGDLSRRMFGNLTKEYVGYFVSKTLASHVGEGQQFSTLNQMSQYEKALATHCVEAAKIVEQFSAEWFSSKRYKGGNDISKEVSNRFAYGALKKMRAELKVRGSRDAV